MSAPTPPPPTPPTAPAPKPARPGDRARRLARRLLVVALALIALLLLVVFGGLVYLRSPSGGERVRQLVVDAANDALAGKLEAKELSLSGDVLVLRGLVLRDPEGNIVAEIEELRARVLLPELAQGRVVLKETRITQPRLYLKQDERGLNLSRAIAARHPKPEEPEKKKSSLVLKLEDLALVNGAVEYAQETGEAPRRYRLENLEASGKADYDARFDKADAQLSAHGALKEPLSGPVALDVNAGLDKDAMRGDVKLDLPGLALDTSARMQGSKDLQVDLRTLRLEPATARAFVPEYPVKQPVALAGKAGLHGDLAQSDLLLSTGSARVAVKGSVDLAKRRTDGLTVTARDINLDELLENGPKTALALDLNARGGGTRLEDLDGEVHLTVPPSKLEGQTVGPVRVEATAKEGQFRISQLLAHLPGLSLTGAGQGDRRTLSLTGKLDASDLSALAQTLGKLTGKKAPALSGHGALDFTLQGATAHPSLTLNGAFAQLAFEDNAVQGLSLSASLADVRKPLEAQANLKASVITLGERHFKDVSAQVTTSGRDLQADFSTKGMADVVVHVGGTLDEDQQGFLLSALAVRYPEADWTLQAPAQVRFGGGAVSAEPIALAAGPQRLTLAGSKQGARLNASVDVERLDLKLLPKAFVDPKLGLAGLLDAHVRAQGTVAKPAVDAKLALRDAAYESYSGLGLALEARYAQDRAQGTLTATAPVTAVDARFDVPVQALLKKRPEPLRLQVDVHELELKQALAFARRDEPFGGRLQAQVVVTGTAKEPLVRAWVRGRGISSDRFPPAAPNPDFDLVLESRAEGKLGARLDLESPGSTGLIEVRTPYTLAQLLEKIPTERELRQAPLEMDVDVRDANLALLNELHVGPELKGRASVRLEARGTLDAPTANAHALAEGLSTPSLPPTRVELGLVATGARTDLTFQADRPGLTLAKLSGGIGAPLAGLLNPDKIANLPVTLDGVVGPVAISELRPAAAPSEDEDFVDVGEQRRAKQVNAVVSAKVAARGTLADPKLELHARADEIRVGDACVGAAVADYGYAGARSTLRAEMRSQGSGTLVADGHLDLDLSYPAVRKGLSTDDAPLAATVKAQRFDVSLFNGFVPKVREIAGLLRADATVGGTLGSPTYRGEAEWTNGRAATMGYGEFKQAHLLARADNERIQLEDLSATSGGGSVRLSLVATKDEDGYVLDGKADLKSFPVVYDDQLLAVATLSPTLQGQATSDVVEMAITMPETHVELPEVERKDLQDLDRPDDVLLVKDGQFLDKKRAKRLQEQKQEQAGAKPAPPGAKPAQPGAKPAQPAQPGATAVAKSDEATEEAEEEAGREYRITLNAPRNIFIKGTDINAELGFSEGFQIQYTDHTALLGDVNFISGRVDALGRKFTVQKGSTVHFSGAAKRPYVYLTAVYVNEREQVTVKITVRGEGKDISFKPTSEPPLSEEEIYTLLATGRRTLKRGSGSSMTGVEAASIVGSLAASQLKKTLSSKVPLDVLTIEATGEESGGTAGARLEAGTYVTDKIYVGYTGRLGANPQKENANAVRLEYQFTPRWSAEGECGDARVCGADLFWSRDY